MNDPETVRALTQPGDTRRVAIVHDWLTDLGGAEKVLEELLALFPRADLFAMVDHMAPEYRGFLGGRAVTTSFIQRLPFSRGRSRALLPLMPLAVEQFDLSGYDLVLSSSYAVAKGVLTGPGQLHVCYCHSPMRYGWDLQHQYLREAGLLHGPKSWLARYLLHRIRLWDYRTANGVDHFIANSHFVARRIRKIYGREATVIHPPVDVSRLTPAGPREDFYLTASRMVPYKMIPMIVEAFARMPDRRLVVIGDGPDFARATRLAAPNIQMMGFQPFDVLRSHLQRARAFVFAAQEDFGIAPLEAQACGTPVIAYGKGGATETIRGLDHPDPTGLFFDQQTPESLMAAVRRFEGLATPIDPEACRRNALRFGAARFRDEVGAFIAGAAAAERGGQSAAPQTGASR